MKNYLKLVIIGGLLAWIYYPTFLWMSDRWMAPDSYFAHGFIIPIVSLYWIFQKRKKLETTEQRGEWLALPLILIAFAMQVFSSLFRIYFVSAFSFVILLFGVIYYIYGRRIIKELWFPLLFLFLMIPLPLLFISQVTLKMKFFVSEISTYLVNAVGIKAVREGSYIYTPNAVCLVGDPCSGLRSFLAFLCLGLIFAYSDRLNMWQKIFLVSLGLPLAIISNVFRVFCMTLLGEIYGMEFVATKVVHDGMGILVFVIALVFFIVTRKKLEASYVSA